MNEKREELYDSPQMKSAEETISVREKLSYGVADVACAMVFMLTISMATYFYTNVIGMSAALVGSVLLISRIFDGVSDVLVGMLVDRTKSKMGKARAWVLWMTVPYGVTLVLMYLIPPHASETVQAIYLFITYNLAVTVVYTALNLPYGTLATLMTRDQHQRSVINIYRMTLSPIGLIIATVVTLPVVNRLGGDQRAWIIVITIYAFLGMGMLLLCFFNTKERVHIPQCVSEEKVPLSISFKAMMVNRYWWLMVGVFFARSIYETINGTMMTYYSQYLLGNNEYTSLISFAEKLPQVVVPVLLIFVIKKFNKRDLALAGAILVLFGQAFVLTNTDSLIVVTIGAFIKGVGTAPIMALMFSMIADCIEYGHWRTGIRAEGLLYSAVTVGYKVGSGIASAVGGFILDASGYNGLAAVQSASALHSISMMFLIFPFAAWGFMALVLWLYRLDREYPKIMDDLEHGRLSPKAKNLG